MQVFEGFRFYLEIERDNGLSIGGQIFNDLMSQQFVTFKDQRVQCQTHQKVMKNEMNLL